MRPASLTVTYFPDVDILSRQLSAIPVGWHRLVVDNGTPEAEWRAVGILLASLPEVEVRRLPGNLGLATAQNCGIRHLQEKRAASHVLLLDQDSEPMPGSALELCLNHQKLLAEGHSVGAVGPVLVDAENGLRHGFHVIDRWRWRRADPLAGPPISCAGLNGSGTFMSVETAVEAGGMDDDLFIDLVDAEWSFRLTDRGLRLYGIPSAAFVHRMGDRTIRLWCFGWRTWPLRSPRRHRYLFRNSILLMAMPHVPTVWKVWAPIKLVLTALVFALSGPQRGSQLVSMARGCLDGLRGRTGEIR